MPEGFINLFHRRHAAAHAGVGVDYVKTSKLPDRSLNRRLDVGLRPRIAAHSDRRAAVGRDHGGGLLDGFGAIEHQNPGTLRGEEA